MLVAELGAPLSLVRLDRIVVRELVEERLRVHAHVARPDVYVPIHTHPYTLTRLVACQSRDASTQRQASTHRPR